MKKYIEIWVNCSIKVFLTFFRMNCTFRGKALGGGSCVREDFDFSTEEHSANFLIGGFAQEL